jgi:hypothetical protein
MYNQNLYPDAAQRIMAIVRKTLGQDYTYFLGLPDTMTLPKDSYPAVIVSKTTGTYDFDATSTDSVTESIYVHLLLDVTIGLGTSDSDDMVARQLQTVVEGRDPSTGLLLPNTLMYALRTNFSLKSAQVPNFNTISSTINITYDAPSRKNMPETREAIIDITVTERQIIPGRN